MEKEEMNTQPVSHQEQAALNGAPRLDPADEKEFQELARQWRQETSHFSYLPQKYRHTAYQKILGMGERAVPLILQGLKEGGGWWFDALAALTNENPAKAATGYDAC